MFECGIDTEPASLRGSLLPACEQRDRTTERVPLNILAVANHRRKKEGQLVASLSSRSYCLCRFTYHCCRSRLFTQYLAFSAPLSLSETLPSCGSVVHGHTSIRLVHRIHGYLSSPYYTRHPVIGRHQNSHPSRRSPPSAQSLQHCWLLFQPLLLCSHARETPDSTLDQMTAPARHIPVPDFHPPVPLTTHHAYLEGDGLRAAGRAEGVEGAALGPSVGRAAALVLAAGHTDQRRRALVLPELDGAADVHDLHVRPQLPAIIGK